MVGIDILKYFNFTFSLCKICFLVPDMYTILFLVLVILTLIHGYLLMLVKMWTLLILVLKLYGLIPTYTNIPKINAKTRTKSKFSSSETKAKQKINRN